MERIVIYCLVIIFSGTVAPKQSSPIRRQTRIIQLLQIVEQLKTCVNDTDPALLPTPENVEKHCEESAIKCFQEAPLTPSNNEEKKMRFDILIKQLRRKLPWKEARKTKPTVMFSILFLLNMNGLKAGPKLEILGAEKCPSCDSFKEKSPQEFLDSLRSLLQKMISYDQHPHHHRCREHCT